MKGMYFSIDALLAIVILAIGVFTIHSMMPVQKTIDQSYVISTDFLNALSELKISELNNSYIKELIAEGNITNTNNTILQQIGEFWSENKTDIARNIILNLSKGIVPNQIKFGVWIDNETIYTSDSPGDSASIIPSRRTVSGIEKFKPMYGYLSRLILTSTGSKTVRSYYYFGGYVGDGNISVKIAMPSSYSSISKIYIEGAVNNTFNLYINSNGAGSYSPQTQNSMRSSKWNVSSSYYSFLKPGLNTVDLKFRGRLGSIGGGYIRIDSWSNNTNFSDYSYNGTAASKKDYLPGIKGVTNLFSSFYVPGELKSLKAHLHFKTKGNSTFKIGSKNVYRANPGNETKLDLTDSNFTGLSYSDLSRKTTPIRFMLEGSEFFGSGIDSSLVTDVSGSMNDCSGVYYSQPYCNYDYCSNYKSGSCKKWASIECISPGHCSADECGSGKTPTRNHQIVNKQVCYTKLDIAKQAGESFVDVIMNNSGNTIALASYASGISSYTNPTNNAQVLKQAINSYNANGYTCICCGIYKALSIMPNLRNDVVVIISDGDANYKCSGSSDYSGSYDTLRAAQSTIDAGRYACSKGITVYTIGYGSDITQQGTQTLKQTACKTSLYYNATNTSKLKKIIHDISMDILKMSYSMQTVYSNYTNTLLFNDSYLQYTYTPTVPPFVFNKIPFTAEGPVFGNNISKGYFNVLDNVTVIDAKVISYSGNKWTDYAAINNSKNNKVVFNLSNFGSSYRELGDPFIVNIPADYVAAGTNSITVRTGVSAANHTGGSADNKAIVTFLVKNSLGYSAIGDYAKGCKWAVEYEGGKTGIMYVPSNYTGNKTCSYKNAVYDSKDSLDLSFYHILSYFDLDKDGDVDVNINEGSLTAENIVMENVPSLWGPSIVETRVWQ
jgi:hypothetical protein